MIVAVDGPAASGKGTIAKRIAAHYGWPHLDTGLLYRAVGRAALTAGIDPLDEIAVLPLAERFELGALDPQVLGTEAVGAAASKVASLAAVRAVLLERQRDFAEGRNAVLDGRDIGTVIFPAAEVKIFVTADLKVRAQRRHADEVARGRDVTLAGVMNNLAERDARDSGRRDAPLRAAEDAVLLDTSEMDIETAVAAALALVEARRVS